MSLVFSILLSLHFSGSGEAAFVLERAHPPRRQLKHIMLAAAPSSTTDAETATSTRAFVVERPRLKHLLAVPSNVENDTRALRREMALRLMKENAMPPVDDELDLVDDANDPLGQYDEDHRTPVETEFINMMDTFVAYSEEDIQSVTTTSTRYLGYAQNEEHTQSPKRPRRRTKEESIRYRALYSGVQAASLIPEVLRSFTVLFEDYLPIRLAGRRIYGYLMRVMEEVREERRGEISRARELCPSWDRRMDSGEDIIEYARGVWDTIVDAGLLLDHSLENVAEDEQSQEGGVLSLPQFVQLELEQVLINDYGLVGETAELEQIVRQIALQEEVELEKYYNTKRRRGTTHDISDGKYLEMTFAIFIKVLYQCTQQKQQSQNNNNDIINILQQLEQQASDQRGAGDTSTSLAQKAVLSGSSSTCKKRKKHSERFDHYVESFKLWESKFIGNDDGDTAEELQQLSRRIEVLRGCFFGARNEKNVAALKIVYMDYAALRLAGDLIFRLMSAIANK